MLQRFDCPILGITTLEAAASTLSGPPSFLDLAWRKGSLGRWIAGRTPLADVALENGKKGLAAVGIQARDRVVEWDFAAAPGEPELSRKLASMEKAFRGELARRGARDAAFRPVEEDALADVQGDLAEALSRTRWAFRSKAGLAEGLAWAARLTPGQCRLARALLAEARDVVAAVDRRLAEPAGQEDMAAARNLGHREDLLEACRVLSSLDQDRCRDRNGMGWSAVASASGHRLAGSDSLDVRQAAHARQIVYPHRRQLSRELRERLGFEA